MTHLLKDNTPVTAYDRVTDGVNIFTVSIVLNEEWIQASKRECIDAGVESGWHLDLEFVDTDGKYHHYISWADGGGVLRHKVTIRYMVDWSRVRGLCIRQGWYTKGNNSEYDHMLLEMIPDEPTDIDTVIEVARDIYNHSDTEPIKEATMYDEPEVIGMIVSYIINECSWTGVTL